MPGTARLVDCLKTGNETEGGKLKRLALSKIVEYLRNAGGLFNKIYVNSPGEVDQLHVKISQLVNRMCSQQACSKTVNRL